MPDLVEQLRQLSELHRSGSLSDSEFNAAKARLLEGDTFQQSNSGGSILALQNELAALDRQWTIEREKYRVSGRRRSSIPEQGAGTKSGAIVAVSGGAWTVMAVVMAVGESSAKIPGPINLFVWIFPVFGVLFIITGLSQGAETNRKADAYQIAEAEYQTKRAALERRIRALS